MTAKLEALDRAYMENIQRVSGLSDELRAVYEKLSVNSEKLSTITEMLNTQNREINRLWNLPRNILFILGGIGTAGATVYGLARIIIKVVP